MKHLNILGLLILMTSGCGVSKKNQKVDSPTSFKYETVSLENMDANVSPQDDFFSYCNGTWVKNTIIPPSESRWGSFNELERTNYNKLTTILESYSTQIVPAGSQANILGAYYASFTNMAKRNQDGLSAINGDLQAIKDIKRKDVLVEFITHQHQEGIGSGFNFGVGQDLKNISKNICYLGQGGIGLPNKEYYKNENKKDILKSYEMHVAKCFEKLGNNAEQAQKAAQNVLLIENKLADSMMTPAQMRIPELTYNKKSFREVVSFMGTFDFRFYLNTIGCKTPDSLVVSNPGFIQCFSTLIETESLAAWKDYLQWNLINHYASHLSEDWMALNFEFYGTALRGKKIQKPMNEQVVDEITNQEFGELLGKAFVEAHFSQEAQTRVNKMVDDLFIVFKERIEGLDWMTGGTKKAAIDKLSAMGRKLGFPSQWTDFSSLNFVADQYIGNVREAAKYSLKKNLDELSQDVDKTKWGMPAHMVNAYYHPLLNEIAFPAGIMQAPFFDVKAEDAVNYGRIGMVIGHEFTHGFDDMGSKFSADGSFNNWWSALDRAAFEQKTEILGQTFSSFCPMEGHCVNAQLTMGENIADLGGLTLAFYAYKRTEEFKSGISREGLTPAQRFFVAYGQLWKIKYTPEEMKNRIATDSHAPGMYRVNGPLKNCPEFFEAFGVSEGKAMRNGKGKLAKIW